MAGGLFMRADSNFNNLDPSNGGSVTRRDFMKITAAGTLAVGAGAHGFAAEKQGDMIYRQLGRTGEKVSAIGLGGYHIGNPPEAEGIRIIRSAIDRGITFMDNCWDYHDGDSEKRMGKALRDGYRDKVFLMTKIDGRTRKLAAKQIDESLQHLQTDHIDLLQHHEVIRVEDPDRIFSEGGAMEAVLEAQKAGKVRFIGFTGHKDPFVHLRMLEIARRHDFRFDAVQMPLNVLDAHYRSFGKEVLPELVKQEIGVLGMKPLASGAALKTGKVTPIECLHYAMSLPTSVVITGCDSMKILDQAFEAARTFQPMSESEVNALLAKTREPALTGKFERFKTAADFDATARHPDWIG
jgi:predicted aldo/keto reductase-like oxidoreductase